MISFLHPWALAGLIAAGLPLVLHLVTRREPPVVVFPAVRYLVETTREHQRRLRLQHWLLLLIRTLLIAALVLAASGPSAPLRQAGGHAPAALALVLDNSLSSGAIVAGAPQLEALKGAARAVLDRATAEDGLWLLAADGVVHHGDRAQLRQVIDDLNPSTRRMDLGTALGIAADALTGDRRPGAVALISDLQATAVSASDLRLPLVVLRPSEPPPPNVGISGLDAGPQPWPLEGGRVTVSVQGDADHPVPVAVRAGAMPRRQALATPGGVTTFALSGGAPGWMSVEAQLDPDELRADDSRIGAVRIAAPAAVAWREDDRFVATAFDVLASSGRVRRGREVTFGSLGPGSSVVLPPADAAEVGAVNRALERRGVPWRFGTLRIEQQVTDSGTLIGREAVLRRYTLVPAGSGRTGIAATVGGEPWVVRSAGIVLVGSRLDPAWTHLPLSAGFVPFLGALVNRLARGEVAIVPGTPGDPVLLPDWVTEVRKEQRSWRAEGGAAFDPPDTGLFFLLAGRDTAGVLAVNPDPRESALTRATDRAVTDLWRGARTADLREAGAVAFAGSARADLRGPLLWTALLLGLAEVALASGVGRAAA